MIVCFGKKPDLRSVEPCLKKLPSALWTAQMQVAIRRKPFRRSSAVEQLTVNQLVVGSIPTAGANFTHPLQCLAVNSNQGRAACAAIIRLAVAYAVIRLANKNSPLGTRSQSLVGTTCVGRLACIKVCRLKTKPIESMRLRLLATFLLCRAFQLRNGRLRNRRDQVSFGHVFNLKPPKRFAFWAPV